MIVVMILLFLPKHQCYQKHKICEHFRPFLHKCYAFDNICVENGFLPVELVFGKVSKKHRSETPIIYCAMLCNEKTA